jgi:hypothetical protein
MKGYIVAVGLLVPSANSLDPGSNAATMVNWQAAAGIAAPQFTEDFESYAIGTDLNGVPLIGGMTLTDTNAVPNVTVQSSSSFFGSSTPFGQGLALRENRLFVFEFAAPTQYFALYDIDDSGSSLTLYLEDNTTATFTGLDTTGSSGLSGEFLGFVSSGPAITKIDFNGAGGDGEWGIDNVMYGAVPEPATMAALGLGVAAMIRRRKR